MKKWRSVVDGMHFGIIERWINRVCLYWQQSHHLYANSVQLDLSLRDALGWHLQCI